MNINFEGLRGVLEEWRKFSVYSTIVWIASIFLIVILLVHETSYLKYGFVAIVYGIVAQLIDIFFNIFNKKKLATIFAVIVEMVFAGIWIYATLYLL